MIKIFGFILLITMTQSGHGYDRITGEKFASRSEVIGQNGMVATSHPLATQIGLDILKQGGTAVDAAIAANIALGLMEPTGNGIGGDLFAIVWDAKSKKLHGLNASGPAPQNISIGYFTENNLKKIPSYGPLPVTVPGAVDGWVKLHEKFGKLEFKSLFSPTIEYANNGFPVTETIAYYLDRSKERFQNYPNFKKVWLKNGKMPIKGEIFKNPQLARTLSIIAEKGRSGFYEGEIAQTIADFIQLQGGFLSYEDLSSFHSEWTPPVSSNYRGYDVWELPPNGQGIAALQILNILENYNLKKMGLFSSEYIHLFTEAKKLAFADRAKYYADPNFSNIPVKELISKSYAKERAKLINMKEAALADEPGILESGDTIYLTAADKYGNMISLIQSNYRGMGSGMMPPGLGFMLQDRGELFSLDKSHRNALQGGKRPFHTIIPAFVTLNGEPFMSFGVMGGATQPQAHAQIIINMVDFGLNLQEAGDAPRIVHSGSSQPTDEVMTNGGKLSLESGFSRSIENELTAKGHKLEYQRGVFGGYQAIMLKDGVYYGASESRKDGQAAGY
ncbi:gamma-glutamyltransferase [SAR86 cluster bacterium SAR86E]|uniref:Glutathione hydrolase proenzyme n=1 Tax=SAR86 cluster bacterium SAR86E TaxID=1208365 RepID=K6GJW5_9GAMM|nr:gamma-glutamyltransferase [SAR86 cluster bacterium SAR86E]